MDFRKEGPKGAGNRKEAPASSQDKPDDSSAVHDQPRPATPLMPVSVPDPSKVSAYLDGIRVSYFKVLLRHPAFLLTEDHGTHEVTRIFIVEGAARCGDRTNGRIGPGVVSKVSFSRVEGLTVFTSFGNIWAPAADCQITWVD